MKKVLIILFYWPPSGGSSVQRWLHFSNYLPEHGWEPIVYAPENPQYPEEDLTLAGRIRKDTKVVKKKIFEPYRLYRKFSGVKDKNLAAGMTMESKPGAFSRIKNNVSVWIRGNFFIPDARMFWIRPSVRFLKRLVLKEKIDAIITTGPPHSLHLIGYHLNKRTGIPWVADFRDPWTRIDFYSELRLTSLADRCHHRLERKVLHQADRVIAIGEDMKNEFTGKGVEKVSLISNGYDEDDVPAEKLPLDSSFSLLHIGTFSRSRNAEALWQALGELTGRIPELKKHLEIKLIGKVDFSVIRSIEKYGLKTYLNHIEYLSHAEAMQAEHAAQVLLLLINNSENARGILTGKFFEYLTSGRPILLIGPEDGDAAAILKETETGQIAAFADKETIIKILEHYFQLFKEDRLYVKGIGTENYSRKKLTLKVAKLLDDVTSG
jgi:hypothetical protein